MDPRPALACLLTVAFVAPARADGLPSVDVTGGAKVHTSISPTGDIDDYMFRGLAGQTVRVAVTLPKRDAPDLALDLVGPDGTALGPADGVVISTKKRKLKLRAVLPTDGTWTLRVRGAGAVPTGDYALKIKHEPPKYPKDADPPRDEQSRVVITIPHVPGYTLGFRLRHRGAVRVDAIVDPDGMELRDAKSHVRSSKGLLELRKYALPADAPAGDYEVRVSTAADIKLAAKVRVTPDPAFRRKKGGLSADEPRITRAQPIVAAGGFITVEGSGLLDANAPGAPPRVFLGDLELLDLLPSPDRSSFSTGVPLGTPLGMSAVRLVTATGQVAPEQPAVEVVPALSITDMSEFAGTTEGCEEVTITGENFRPGRMEFQLDGNSVSVDVLETTPTLFRFLTPAHAVGSATFGLRDADTEMHASLPIGSYGYVLAPKLNRVAPPFVPVLGGELVQVRGGAYTPLDRIVLERADGSFEDVTASQVTFVNEALHTFVAPVRPLGTYRVNVRDEDGFESPRVHTLTYFSLTDLTSDLGLDDAQLGAVQTVALCSFDFDDIPEHLVLASEGGDELSATSLLRLFRLTETGFRDVTASTVPQPTDDDDWRARRVVCIDVTEDLRRDLILLSNDDTALDHDRSRLRILEAGSFEPGGSPMLVDRTEELMAPARFNHPARIFLGSPWVADTWRGLDLWVGDLDGDPGRPELLVTGDEIRSDPDLGNLGGFSCDPPGPGNYCSLPNSAAFEYAFYWSATRLLRWDEDRRGGLGQFAFQPNGFPRRQGLLADIPVGGSTILGCNQDHPCEGTFTPFAGNELSVGDFDGDGDLDVAVLSDQDVFVDGERISPLQIALQGHEAVAQGVEFGDITRIATEIGIDLHGTALAAGTTTYPDGVPHPALAISTSAPVAGTASVLRVFRFVEPVTDDRPVAFEEITEHVVPATTATERWQATDIEFVDIDRDGDDDLVLVDAVAPGEAGSALRVLRSTVVDQVAGVFTKSLQTMVDGLIEGDDRHAADGLTIGDLAGDGNLTLLLTRSFDAGDDPQLRVLSTQTE